ncbi:MAG: HAD hydrolase-like protein [Phycisphaerae bacterium]|nr:HAD hydrolase-like protein [Phycisphaerae bacterium]
MISMPDYQTILLDLDGTLTDPTEEMISSAKYALKQFGIKERDPERLNLFTTIPLLHCFEENFGLTREQADQAFIHYWYYAGTFGVGKNRPFDGVPEMLQKLHSQGKTLCIATARQTKNVEQILKTLNLDQYFTIIMGASEDESRRTKKMIIFDLLCDLPDHTGQNVIMVGDRTVDITGAKDNALDSMAVTYGAESVEDLLQLNPTYVVNNVSEMAAILLGEEETADLHMSGS